MEAEVRVFIAFGLATLIGLILALAVPMVVNVISPVPDCYSFSEETCTATNVCVWEADYSTCNYNYTLQQDPYSLQSNMYSLILLIVGIIFIALTRIVKNNSLLQNALLFVGVPSALLAILLMITTNFASFLPVGVIVLTLLFLYAALRFGAEKPSTVPKKRARK